MRGRIQRFLALSSVVAGVTGCPSDDTGADTDGGSSSSGTPTTGSPTTTPSTQTGPTGTASTDPQTSTETTESETTVSRTAGESSSSTAASADDTSSSTTSETTGPCALESEISLASTMDPAGGISEDMVTGSLAAIDRGDGGAGDADGLYDITNPDQQFGSIDVFPSEEAFAVGSATIDTTAACAPGENVVESDAFDLSGLWEAGSSTSDISDAALTLWFFKNASTFTFTPSGEAPTLTFNDGVLTSIDAAFTFEWTIDLADPAEDPTWTGTLTFAGDTISLQLDDTQTVATPFGDVESNAVIDLSGVVDAVSAG